MHRRAPRVMMGRYDGTLEHWYQERRSMSAITPACKKTPRASLRCSVQRLVERQTSAKTNELHPRNPGELASTQATTVSSHVLACRPVSATLPLPQPACLRDALRLCACATLRLHLQCSGNKCSRALPRPAVQPDTRPITLVVHAVVFSDALPGPYPQAKPCHGVHPMAPLSMRTHRIPTRAANPCGYGAGSITVSPFARSLTDIIQPRHPVQRHAGDNAPALTPWSPPP